MTVHLDEQVPDILEGARTDPAPTGTPQVRRDPRPHTHTLARRAAHLAADGNNGVSEHHVS